MTKKNQFDYGFNEEEQPQQNLFTFDEPVIPPCPPVTPKQLRIKVIDRPTAKNIWLRFHYLKRDVPGASLELGVFTPDHIMRGALCFSKFVVGTKDHANTWELRRMWLSDDLPRNSESRILAVSLHLIKKLNPDVRWIVSYSDPSRKHKGTIYKAAGFFFDGMSGISQDGFNAYGNTKEIDQVSKKRWKKYLWR